MSLTYDDDLSSPRSAAYDSGLNYGEEIRRVHPHPPLPSALRLPADVWAWLDGGS